MRNYMYMIVDAYFMIDYYDAAMRIMNRECQDPKMWAATGFTCFLFPGLHQLWRL